MTKALIMLNLPYFSTYKALLFKAQAPPASYKPIAPLTSSSERFTLNKEQTHQHIFI
jgi:hypothetical protein